MQFSDVIGQDEVKRQLCLSVREGRIPHAQLFTGATGVGKLPLALAYAQYIACPHRTDTDSCGVCPTCIQYRNLQHPDLHFAFPIVKTNDIEVCDDVVNKWREQILEQPYFDQQDWYKRLGVETKQGVIYDKESGEIIRKLSLKSFDNGYKVMIIWLPEKMNASCANKILKLIEEPPTQTLFLLISEHPEQLLPTIISRTQEIHVPRLSETDIQQALLHITSSQTPRHSATQPLSLTTASYLAHVANGSLIEALRAVQQSEDNQQNFNDFVALMRNAWLVGNKKDYNALLQLRQWSNSMADAKVGREKQKNFLQYAQRQIRENYIYNFHAPDMNYQTENEQNFSTKFAPFINDGNVEKIMNELSRAEQQIAQNGNAKIIFFDLCLQMIVLIKKQ